MGGIFIVTLYFYWNKKVAKTRFLNLTDYQYPYEQFVQNFALGKDNSSANNASSSSTYNQNSSNDDRYSNNRDNRGGYGIYLLN